MQFLCLCDLWLEGESHLSIKVHLLQIIPRKDQANFSIHLLFTMVSNSFRLFFPNLFFPIINLKILLPSLSLISFDHFVSYLSKLNSHFDSFHLPSICYWKMHMRKWNLRKMFYFFPHPLRALFNNNINNNKTTILLANILNYDARIRLVMSAWTCKYRLWEVSRLRHLPFDDPNMKSQTKHFIKLINSEIQPWKEILGAVDEIIT